MTDNITLPRATVQQALEALLLPSMKTQQMLIQRDEAIIALRRALEQQAEPVFENLDYVAVVYSPSNAMLKNPLPIGTHLYKYPPQRKPLSEKQVHKIWRSLAEGEGIDEFARALEAAHGIKEGT